MFKRIGSKSVVLPLLVFGGCASIPRWTTERWATDYEAAERKASESGRARLIVFKDGRPHVDRPFDAMLKRSDIKARTRDFVRCVLYRDHEPDRRYADQFHVQKAPGLIVAHPDGTYHVHTGSMQVSSILEFLDGATAPGTPLSANPHIVREAAYRWHRFQFLAEREMRHTGKSMLVVFERRFTADWWKLGGILERPEIYRRFADTVHCRLTTLNPFSSSIGTSWGNVQLPALAVVHPGGEFAVLEMPNTEESVAAFADQNAREIIMAAVSESAESEAP